MAFSPAFAASQPEGQPSVITLTDTSTGSDGTITSRRVFLRKDDGTYLVPDGTITDYIVWDYADAGIDIDCMSKDYALYITVQWLTISSTPQYTANGYSGFTSYNEEFDYTLTSMMSANRLLVNDNSFRSEKFNVRMYIDSGNNALSRYSDISNAQICYDAATDLRNNSQYVFNESTG